MAPRNRTTPEQHAWLMSLRPEFLERQNEKKLPDFWAKLDLGWFTRWPEPGVAEAELEAEGHPLRNKATKALGDRKSYLRNWFNNRAVVKKKAAIKLEPLVTTFRSHQPVELYSRQFYKEKIQPLFTDKILREDIPKSKKLGVVKALTKAAFDAEPDEVRDAFFAQASALKAENAARRVLVRESELKITPEAYATAIESVAHVLDAFIQDLSTRTGWAFSVMGGGPDPVNGGRIQTISFHEGRNAAGATFRKAHVSFEDSVLKPYIEFLNQIYSPAICEARALTTNSEDNRNGGPIVQDESTPMQDGAVPFRGPSEPQESANQTESGTLAIEPSTMPTPPQIPNDIPNMDFIDPRLRPTPTPPTNAATNDVQDIVNPQVRPTSPSLPTPAVGAPPFVFPPTNNFAPPTSPIPTTSAFSVASVYLDPPPLLITTLASTPPPPPSPVPNQTPPAKNPAPKTSMPRKRPTVQPPSALQKITERNVAETATVAEKDSTWSKELSKALSTAQARAVKAAEAKATRAEKAAKARAARAVVVRGEGEEDNAAVEGVSAPAPNAQFPQAERPQRVRKAAISKEVISLTDARKRKSAKENDSCPNPKKKQTR
ncbi:hypothetical protein BDZ94DRAFT_1322018 [Collybia nuda]|uniref:Uncharacterized protein n=1 Tax=Collybia nuda TaxID=64659 RepID=A0A9P5Y8H5_9AGAR|nr:hypothetical protein BDZ94DRAFT_1322018 [Collybia nuda]